MALKLLIPRDSNSQPVLDPLTLFRVYKEDTSGDPQYSMSVYIGIWYIRKNNIAAETQHFYAGTTDKDDAFDNRASLAYVPYDVFLTTLLSIM